MFKFYIFLLQCITIFTGLICLWRKGPVLLWLILVTKIFAGIIENVIADQSMQWWGISRSIFYNLFAFIDITTWCSVYFILFRHYRNLKKIAVLVWVALVMLQCIEISRVGMHNLSMDSISWFCAASIMFSLLYFIQVLKNEEYNLKADPGFWLCCAAVSFHPVLLVNLLSFSDPGYRQDSFSATTFDILQFIGIGFYNIFICVAFLTFYKYRLSYRVSL